MDKYNRAIFTLKAMVSNIKITFFGTGGSWPNPGRGLPSVCVQVDDIVNVFDCGEGTQKQIMKSRVSFMRINNIFITHFHGDHFLGMLGLIQSMSFNNRKEPLNLYGPPGAVRILSNALNVGYYTLGFDVRIYQLYPGREYDFDKFTIRTHWNDHPVPALAYSLEEKDLIKIDKEAADRIGIPSRRLEELRDKGSIVFNGRTVSLGEVARGVRKGRKIVYTGDTRPMESMKEFARDADVLIHDTTTDSSLEPDVNTYGHTSARQAAEIARDAGVKRLYLFHYSPRISDVNVLLEEALKICENTVASRELMEYEVRKREEITPLA